jgi:hypothetical protein
VKSVVAITDELDNAKDAAHQLAGAVREKLELGKSSVGILLCDADMDGATVTGELKGLLGIDVVGMTTLASLDSSGRHEAAGVLTILTADDCLFRAAVSDSLANDGYARNIAGAYEKTVPADAGREAGPGIVFAFCPYGMPFSGDKYPSVLSEAAGDAPVMGGVASDDYDCTRARVFFSGKEYRDALSVVGVWGNVKPVFSIRHVTSRFAERIRRITEAEGNIVRKVGDETFVRYLEGFGLKTDVSDPLLAFAPYPLMLTRDGDDEVPLMRHISGLDPADGSGSFFGDVPIGAQANICLIKKDDITAACRESMEALLSDARNRRDYDYSLILCFSCCGRAIILAADADAEGRVLSEMLPGNLALAGAYCLGEICPTRYREGRASNRFHNCSITFCML